MTLLFIFAGRPYRFIEVFSSKTKKNHFLFFVVCFVVLFFVVSCLKM